MDANVLNRQVEFNNLQKTSSMVAPKMVSFNMAQNNSTQGSEDASSINKLKHTVNRSSNLSRKPHLPELIVPGKNLFSKALFIDEQNDNSDTSFKHLPDSETRVHERLNLGVLENSVNAKCLRHDVNGEKNMVNEKEL